MIVSEKLIEEHLRIVEICENESSVIIGDLPLIQINLKKERHTTIDVGNGVSIRFMNIATGLGVAEIEIYHVMGMDTTISFVIYLKGCGHNLMNIYNEIIKSLMSEGSK